MLSLLYILVLLIEHLSDRLEVLVPFLASIVCMGSSYLNGWVSWLIEIGWMLFPMRVRVELENRRDISD